MAKYVVSVAIFSEIGVRAGLEGAGEVNLEEMKSGGLKPGELGPGELGLKKTEAKGAEIDAGTAIELKFWAISGYLFSKFFRK